MHSEEFSASETTERNFAAMADFGKRHRRARILYQKPNENRATWRLVEPYDFVAIEGCDVSAIRCIQIKPKPDETPWRSFRLDRIRQIRDGGKTFKPRRWQSIETGEITHFDVRRTGIGRPKVSLIAEQPMKGCIFRMMRIVIWGFIVWCICYTLAHLIL